MTAINFPSSPVNGDTLTSGNTTYTYNAAKTRWDAVTTVNGIQLNSLSVGAEAPASGDGSIAYNNTSGVFTYTPPVIADPLPAQTGNTGKYLTTDGSTTSWAEVASGGGLSFIQDFTASGSITANTPVVLNSTGTVSALGEVVEGSTAVNYGLQYAMGAQYSDGNLVYDSQNDQFIMYKYGGLKIGKMVGSSITWGSFIDLGLNGFLTIKANSVYDATLDRHIVLGPAKGNIDTPTTVWQAQVGDGTYNYIAESYTETSELQRESHSLWNCTQLGPVSVGPGKVLFLYRAAGTFDPTINIATGTVDSTFTFGTPVTLTSKDTDSTSNSSVAIAYSETAGVAYAAYINTSRQLEYAIIDVSGASPVVLSTHILVEPINNGNYAPISANLVIKDNYVILGYYHTNQPFKTKGGYIDSGTKQITFGTSATSSLNAGSTGTIRIVYTKYNNFAVLQQGSSTIYNISNYTVSEQGALTSISSENVTLESAPTFQNGMLFMAFSTVDNNLLINYSTSSGTSYGYSGWRDYGFVHKAQTLASVASNADRFLGFATTSVADAATVPVTLVGVQGGLSGLTPATDYYITGTGSLSSGDTGYRKVGTALSSSSILMDDSSNVIGYATTSYVDTAITNLVDSSPAALNTLNELAAALGDDANFSTTVTNSIASKADDAATTSALATKAPLASPTFTGVPVAPTATAGTNTTQIATTAFVTAATIAAAGDTLPAQTDNAGKYLTTDGSSTSWATVSAGAGYEIGDGLELNSVISGYSWPANPNLAFEIESTFFGEGLGKVVAATSQYLAFLSEVLTLTICNASTGAVLHTIASGGVNFRQEISISGNNVAVSKVDDTVVIYNANTGALVRTFTSPGTWTFGEYIAVDGDVIAISSAGTSTNVYDGYLHVYSISTGALLWQKANPNSDGGDSVDTLTTVAISSDYVAACAINADSGASNGGLVYVFDINTGDIVTTISSPSPLANQRFGSYLSSSCISGTTIAITTRENSSSIYLFNILSGALLATVNNPNPQGGTDTDYFGRAEGYGRNGYAVLGNYLAVSAYGEDVGGEVDNWSSGSVYLFNITDTNNISLQYSLHGPAEYGNAQLFGGSIALTEEGLYIGARGTRHVDGDGITRGTGSVVKYSAAPIATSYLQPDNTIATTSSPTFTGVPVAPTATAGTNTTQIATTAFVAAATAAAAGDTLPAQTGNTGKYLTTDGSTTSWAEVASGAGYEIGDGLEVQGVTAYDWSTIPAPTASVIGTTIGAELANVLAASSSYVVTAVRGPGTTFSVYNAQTGSFERNITKPGSGNTYYAKLGISGTKIICGNSSASGNAGAAAIFEATTGNQIRILSTTGTRSAGRAVAISPTYAAVCSLSDDSVDAYVDIYSVSTGDKIYTLSNPDIVPTGGEATGDDGFGLVISMSDSYLVVAAWMEEASDGKTNSGAVYVYDTPTGTLLQTLIPSTPVANAQYGYTVALHGDYIAVGTSVGPYVFIYSASTGSLLRTISDPKPGSNKFGSGWGYGSAISIDDIYLLVGAPNTHTPLENGGAAYLFDITNGSLLHTISPTSLRENLGSATALAPGILVVGSSNFDNGNSDGSADYGKFDLYNTTTSTINYLKPDNTIATTSYVDTAITNLVDSSPAALNTLNELAAALGDDANFSTTVTNTLAEKAPLANPTFTGVTTLTATSEVLQPKFSAFAGSATHDMANGSVFYHDLMMGNFYPEFINVPTTVDLVTSAVLVMADGQMWGPGTHARVNGTEYAVKWLGGTAPTMSEDVVDVVSYSLINRNGTWVVIGSHSAYSAAV